MFREKVKELMNQENITQKELSELSGITESSISRYLNGERTPRIDIIINFAKALKVNPNYLICNDDDLSKKETAYIQCHTMLARNKNNLSKTERDKLILLLVSRDK
jgi:transcriptional regulator with XRE-family HTH domain